MRAAPTRGLLTRLVETVLVTSRLYARPTAGAPAPLVAPPYAVRRATTADLGRFEGDLAAELRPGKAAMIVARAQQPDLEVFVAALPDGTICGFGHTEYERIRDAHLRVDLGARPGTAHLFDDFVATAHRGHRLQAALLAARVAGASDRGATTATILVEDSNRASRASVVRAGFAPSLRVVTLRAGRLRRSWALGHR